MSSPRARRRAVRPTPPATIERCSPGEREAGVHGEPPSTTPSPGPRRHRPSWAAVPAPMELLRQARDRATPSSRRSRRARRRERGRAPRPSRCRRHPIRRRRPASMGDAGSRSGTPAPPRHGEEVLSVAARAAHDLDVAFDAEVVVIHPVRPAKPKGRPSQTLSEPRHSTGPRLELGPEEIEVHPLRRRRRRRCGERQPCATAEAGRRPPGRSHRLG